MRLLEPVTELRRHLGSRAQVHRTFEVDGLALSTSWVPDRSVIEVDLVLESIFEGIVATGTVSAPFEGECRRCLGPVTGHIEVEVREIFSTDPVEGETWPLAGDTVDLEPVLRDAVLLGLPLAPLCGPDCAGPAPDAYPAAVEAEDDGHDQPARDPRWAALDDLDLGDS